MIYSVIPVMNLELMSTIKVESFHDGKWVDVTHRCQLVDVKRGIALLLGMENGHAVLDDDGLEAKREWHVGRFRVEIPGS